MPRQKIECPDCGHQHYVTLQSYMKRTGKMDDPLESYLSGPDEIEELGLAFADMLHTTMPDYDWDRKWGNPLGEMVALVEGDVARAIRINQEIFKDPWVAEKYDIPFQYLDKFRRAVGKENHRLKQMGELSGEPLESPAAPATPTDERWEQVVFDLQGSMDGATHARMIQPAQGHFDEESKQLTILVPSSNMLPWLERLNGRIQTAVTAAYGTDVTVSYERRTNDNSINP